MSLSITGFYAGLLALLFIVLSINVIRMRLKFKVGTGDGEQEPLIKAIRVHGNFIEYVPLTLILLAAFEFSGGNALWLHILGGALFVSRILHAMGLTKSLGTSLPRQIGTLTNFIVLLVLSVLNIGVFLT